MVNDTHPSPATPSAMGPVRVWGAVDQADWNHASVLLRRMRPLVLRIFLLLILAGYVAFAVWRFRLDPTVGAVLLVFLLSLMLRLRRLRRRAIHRRMEKSERGGGSPHWVFEPDKVAYQAGFSEGCIVWQVYDKLAADDEMILLVRNRHAFDCLPARFFQAGEMERVIGMARAAGLPVFDFRKHSVPRIG